MNCNLNSPLSTECLLQSLVADSQEAIICFHLDGTVVLWNAAAEKLYGYSAEEIVGRHVSLIHPLYEVPSLNELLRNPLCTGVTSMEPVERLHKTGARLALQIQRSPVRNEAGIVIAMLEKSGSSNAVILAAAAEAQLRLLTDQMPVVFWTANQRLRITSHWGSGFRGLRVFRNNAPGQTVHGYLRCKEDQETPMKQHLDALRGVSSRFEYRWHKHFFDISLEPMRNADGEVIGCIGVALDITERKKTEEEIRYQATHDGLTGLVNYREFLMHLEDELRRADRSGRSFGLLLLDLDGLKLINDRLGHLAGNRALKQLAHVMKDNSRATDISARYGGDEFALLLIDADYPRSEQVASRIRESLRTKSGVLPLTVSIGAAVYPQDGRTAQELLEIADRRLYADKKSATERFHTAAE
jgi:diguanylate cyclase (GGDEF)-like protein/PAS domain S-box-containing protein